MSKYNVKSIIVNRLEEIATRKNINVRDIQCNKCGDCCSVYICGIGELFVGNEIPPPCPLLEDINGERLCGAVLYSNIIFPGLGVFFSLALGVGLGCCNGDKVGLIEKEIVIKN